jgi:hypothetical protein
MDSRSLSDERLCLTTFGNSYKSLLFFGPFCGAVPKVVMLSVD